MGDMLFSCLATVHHEILLFAAVGLAIGGVDEFIIDLSFLGRSLWRHCFIYSRHQRMTTASLPASPRPGRIAVLIPAWQEAAVIGPMLRNALSRWDGDDVRIFIGLYPNDRATWLAAAAVAQDDERLILCIHDRDGPTTKADCLNNAWRAMVQEEARTCMAFKAVVLHDAEDVVHRDEIRLFDVMIDRFALVQLPVLPLPGQGRWWSRGIANHYGDEFAESHGKGLTVREAMGASMPSAGVACAFDRHMLQRLVHPSHGGPFDPASLTEDYEVGLRISNMGGRGAFVRMRDGDGQLVATREYFPDDLNGAVRQKARWIVGISLAGWDRMGWQGGPTEWWMRMRDRAAALSAFILFTAYLALILWAILLFASLFTALPTPRPNPAIAILLWVDALFMAWRMIMRTAFSTRAYGWRFGLGAIPRTFVANLIAIMAARRATGLYLKSLTGRPLAWDKTQHRFPDLASAA